MDTPSVLRIAGIGLSIAGIVIVLSRRRQRVLSRLELFVLVGLLGVGLVGAFPGLADVLPRLTGFTGNMSRITSLLVFAVLGLAGLLTVVQGQLAETRFKFFDYLRKSAVEHAPSPSPSSGPVDVAIVMPAFNEAENLEEVLRRAPKSVDGASIQLIVVDDGSEDGTVAAARAGGAWVVRNPVNVGGGHALKIGFLAAQRIGARYVVTMDADGQHRFEDLPAVLEALRAGADVVIGSRHLGASIGHEAARAIGLRVFNAVLTFLVGRPITDCSSGFRGFAMARFGELRLVQERHHTAEMIIEASRRGLTIAEVPITIVPRLHGESKKGTNLWYGVRFANTIFSTWWRR
jgi:uncharacterized membrane protein YuzA (DUF378 family)